MGCVYGAKCSVNGKLYIGKTKGTLMKRRIQHLSHAKSKRRSVFHKAIFAYGPDSFTWEVLFESDDEAILYAKEQELIVLHNTMVPNGYNLTTGGDGNYDVHFDEEWHLKNQRRADAMGKRVYCVETDAIYVSYAEASHHTGVPASSVRNCCKSENHLSFSKLHFCYATPEEIENLKRLKDAGLLEKKKSVSSETIEMMRQRETGRKRSPEFCARRRQIMLENNPWRGKHPTAEHLQRMSENRRGKCTGADNGSARPVLCVELNQIFLTMKDAVATLELPHKGANNISSCCAGKLKTAYGYHWQYVDSPSIEKDD